ncbi:11-beta-hydroxysteroid dehydrogenase A-like isoform X1 [Juglans microcarpa x Juglans regia]|uniref:11-beta-hydroxysteroid dehydrogenase A-like isoform X1 n=1 Tax=Juglans microcarpa x Juglans regia TaxID=2249226 RepID=UPI001B7DE451|nr:11-beta-hydroxysteroid dehydrogenase A-like isoform X1 [Juglans microcarpa x Juglans regia]
MMALLDLIHKFLNVVAPPFTFFSLCLLLPPYSFFKLFLSFFNFIFSEDLAGKVVLITGASSGIGEHLAYEYAKRGARLSLAARRESSLREVVDRALDYGSPDVLMIPADVSNVEDSARIVEETMNHFGRLDHLVNNAGINSICMFEEATDITAFRTIMDTNFWGSAYTTRFSLPYLRESRGKIIALASSAAWLPTPRMSFYNASKAAMVIFYETLRVEIGPEIKITIVTPGFIESEMTQGKFLLKEGEREVDQDLRDVQLSAIPVETVGACAAAIVKSACRGDRYLTEPAWFKVTYFWKVFCPEVIEWCYRLMYMNSSPQEAPSKKILDLTGAKNILYPSTLHTSEIKTD